jgi:putative flavoprotein involved in K+ transport
MKTFNVNEKVNWGIIIIGAGQAGLAAGYHLSNAGKDFVIIDAVKRIGDSWRQRWDSLRLFTPSQYDGLPGLPFPKARGTMPSKDENGGLS